MQFVEFAQATILEWPAPEDAYVLSEQQVGWKGGAAPAAFTIHECLISFTHHEVGPSGAGV